MVLEKKQFPRDKHCGDAVCKTAIEILMEMGLYEKLIKENKAHVADSGGLCSPGEAPAPTFSSRRRDSSPITFPLRARVILPAEIRVRVP